MLRFLFAIAVASTCGGCATAAEHADSLTVVLDFERSHSPQSFDAMQREATVLFKDSGVHLNWQTRDNIGDHTEFHDLIFVRMKGHCDNDDYFMPVDERGPLGMSYSSDGGVLPFGQVDCDQIKSSLRRSAPLHGGHISDSLLGRAMGRVLAHEMYHMLTNDRGHNSSGISRQHLSADDLTRDTFVFSGAAIRSLGRRLRAP